jgi:hypothetical protein
LKGIQGVLTLSSCSLDVTDAAVRLLETDAQSTVYRARPRGRTKSIEAYEPAGNGPSCIFAASKRGKVAVVGGFKMFLDDFVDQTGYQNGRLFANIVRWLVSKRQDAST